MKKINLVGISRKETLIYAEKLYHHLQHEGHKVFLDRTRLSPADKTTKSSYPGNLSCCDSDSIQNYFSTLPEHNLLLFAKENKQIKSTINNIISEFFDYKITVSQKLFKSDNIIISAAYEQSELSLLLADKEKKGSITAQISDKELATTFPLQIATADFAQVITLIDAKYKAPVFRKKQIRKQIKKIKESYSSHDRKLKSAYIMSSIEASQEFKDAEYIFIYWAMDDEVDTREFICKWAKEKKFILPTVQGDDLILKQFEAVEQLKDGEGYGIPEPGGNEFKAISRIELAIIPGVAFDAKNNRLGRGKGYYDKTLKAMKNQTELIGVCFDFQVIEHVPIESHDITLDRIISG